MASSQSLRVAEAPRRKIVINVTSALLECAAIRDLDPSNYLLELFRADLASVRLVKLQQSRHSNFVDKKPPPKTSDTINIHKRQKDATENQRILHLHLAEGLNIHALAERFGRSPTSIALVLNTYSEAAHVPSTAPSRPPNSSFGDFCLDGSVPLPRRAKAVPQ